MPSERSLVPEASSSNPRTNAAVSGRISYRKLSKLFYRLDKSYSAGLDLLRIFRREAENSRGSMKRVMTSIADEIERGNSLGDAMKKQGNYFPPLVKAIVYAGEKGGRLDEAFRKLHEHFDEFVKFQIRLLSGIAWPLFELAAAIVIIGIMILLLGYVYETNRLEPIDWFGMGLGPRGDFVLYGVIVSLLLAGAFVLIQGTLKGWFGELPMRIARRIPLIGHTIEALSLSRLAWTLSMAENSGMSAGASAGIALEATQNVYFVSQIKPVQRKIAEGESFHAAFESTGAFNQDFLIHVQNGESTGQLAETMEHVSKVYQEQAENNLRVLSVIGFVLTFLLVAVIIVSVVVMMYMNLYVKPIQDALNFR